jgi:hypothetical protein
MRHQAVYNTHPKVKSIGSGDSWEYFDENYNSIEIDESLVTLELEKLQKEYDDLAYSRSREAEYPTVQECVHAILDDTLDALQAKRASVKLKYPKGG